MDPHTESGSSEPYPAKDLASVSKPKKADAQKSKHVSTGGIEITNSTLATASPIQQKTKSQAQKQKRKHEEIDSFVDDPSITLQTSNGDRSANSQRKSKKNRRASRSQDRQGVHQVNGQQIGQNGPSRMSDMASVNHQGTQEPYQSQDKPKQQDQHDQPSKRSKKMAKKHHDNEPLWKLSEPIGGLFAGLPPVFSPDEEHLMLAQARAVKIYATATSTLLRTCKPDGHGISSFCLSAKDPNTMYLLLDAGIVQLWNWTTAEKLSSWKFTQKTSSIAVSTMDNGTDTSDVIFATETQKNRGLITVHRIKGHERRVLGKVHQTDDPIQAIKVLGCSQYLVAVTSSSVIVGSRHHQKSTKDEKLHYTFRTFRAPEKITCFDARVNTAAKNMKTGASRLDVVVGLEDGSLRIYSGAEPETGKHKDKQSVPANIKAHWHRHAVGSVAWASDGNYVISGGRETVLVLWQLDTNTQTKIPHLTSAIESIVVSTRGASYAIRLTDNSIMIVGTQDFVPTFHIAGVAFPSTQLHTDKLLAQRLPSRRMPVTSVLTQPPRLMSAVPSDMLESGRAAGQISGSYTNTSLQSTILSSVGAAVSRQALVDNNATTVRRRPDGHELVPPNVVLMAADSDGTWLATVDEWYQPLSDILHNSAEPGEASKAQLASVVVNLVFWSWNKETNSWDSSTRVPGPHTDNDESLPTDPLVLDLIAAPGPAAFWTLGANGRMKYWTIRKRTVLGSRAITAGGKEATSIWRCTRSINVPYASKGVNDVAPSGRIVTTKDGSVFAISKMTSQGSEVTVFTLQSDETTRQIFTFKLHHQGISIAFLNQWLIIADHESVLVRNLTDTTRWYNAALEPNGASLNAPVAPHLAIDDARQVFAISLAQKKIQPAAAGNNESKILIFSAISGSPIATFDHQPASAALISIPSTNKFYTLTTGAEIYSISHGSSEPSNTTLNEELNKATTETLPEPQGQGTFSKIFGKLDTETIHVGEEETALGTESLRKKIAWNDIPGLNLDQPFALPKTSAIQRLSATAIGA